MRRSLSLLALAWLLGGCALDSFLFSGKPVPEYRWDEADPNIDGELTDPHPSIVPAADRSEGFLDIEGARIHWVFARREGATTTILYSHGTSRNIGRYWDRVERLWSDGYSVLIYDYPGYGLSTGTTTEAGVLAAGRASLEHLLTLPGVDPDRIVVYGYSLGGGPTYDLAGRAARGEGPEVAALISESTFCSVEALVQDGSFLDLAPGYFANARFDNCARIAELEIPVLIVHGLADDYVVPRHATMLRDRALREPATYFVEGAGHSNLPLVAGEAYDEEIDAFLSSIP
jgi:hypothetical protein